MMRADGATHACRIVAIREIGVPVVVRDDSRIRFVGRKLDRRSIAPAAHELGGELFFSTAVQLALFLQIFPESGDILMQLAVHHERAVAGQQMRNRRDRKFARFVGIAQQEFARGQRFPSAIGSQFALPRYAHPAPRL